VAVDEGGPVGLHAGGDGFAVVGVGVVGIVLESDVGKMLGLGDAIVEALLEGGVDGWAFTGFEAAVVGEELDVKDAEAVEFGEDVGGCVGCGAYAIVRVSIHPLLEVAVGGGEVEVVHGVVAVVERCAAERGAGGEGEGRSEEKKKEAQDVASTGEVRGGMDC
jgi:hypothetical protein